MATMLRALSNRAIIPKALRAVPLAARPALPSRLQQQRLVAQATQAVSAEVPTYSSEYKGAPQTESYRVFFKQGSKTISPWHEIPLHTEDGFMHYICEIPKETKAKMEVATSEECTPIKQDTKKGQLRDYGMPINWNYGLLPQTWEDPSHKDTQLDASGDNDPVDVVEIGSGTHRQGGVYKVKPLGIYAMIDEGELDWKVIVISLDDPKAAMVNDVADVEKHFPGELEKVMVWFRDYKTLDGKPQNKFGYDYKCQDAAFAKKVIQQTHEAYIALKSGARKNTEELSLV